MPSKPKAISIIGQWFTFSTAKVHKGKQIAHTKIIPNVLIIIFFIINSFVLVI